MREANDKPADDVYDPFEGVGPTVGYCSKCGEARDAFYTCRHGGHTTERVNGDLPRDGEG